MQNHRPLSQAIFDQVEKAQSILLIGHRRPDGDAIGSNLGLGHYLKTLGKKVEFFCVDPVPTDLQFLPGHEWFTTEHTVFTEHFDLVMTLDCASLEFAGVADLVKIVPGNPPLINIDHHVSNPAYGQINLIIEDASSTAEIIFRLLSDWKITWNKNIAECLATGLVTDTSGFKNGATTYHSLAAASELLHQGADLPRIIQRTLLKTDAGRLKLLGRALERLQNVPKYQLVYTYLLSSDFTDCGLGNNDTEGIANTLHILNEGSIVLVLSETSDGLVKGSMRTSGDIDLSRLANLMGGGGHKKAAGFSLPGKLLYDKNKLQII